MYKVRNVAQITQMSLLLSYSKTPHSTCSSEGDQYARLVTVGPENGILCHCPGKGSFTFADAESSENDVDINYLVDNCDCYENQYCQCTEEFMYSKKYSVCLPKPRNNCDRCHPYAKCYTNSFNQPYCRCQENLRGDGINECSTGNWLFL